MINRDVAPGVVMGDDAGVEGAAEEEVTGLVEVEVKGRNEAEEVSSTVLVDDKEVSVDRVFEMVEIEDKDTVEVYVVCTPDPDDVVRVGVVTDDDSPAVKVRDKDAEGEVSAVEVPSDAVSRVDEKSSVDAGVDDVRVDEDV